MGEQAVLVVEVLIRVLEPVEHLGKEMLVVMAIKLLLIIQQPAAAVLELLVHRHPPVLAQETAVLELHHQLLEHLLHTQAVVAVGKMVAQQEQEVLAAAAQEVYLEVQPLELLILAVAAVVLVVVRKLVVRVVQVL